MKFIKKTLFLIPLLAYSQTQDPQAMEQAQQEQIDQARKQLAQEISAIAENEDRDARGYRTIAETIAATGEAMKQQNQAPPEPPIFDGLQAIDLGEQLNPLETDWAALRERLETLLDKPPPQDQQDQNDQQQDEENQDQEPQDGENNQQGQDGQENQNSDQQNESSNENQESQPQQDGQDNQQSEGDKNNPDEQNGEGQEEPSQAPNKENGGVGDLDESAEQPKLDQPGEQPPPKPQAPPMQQVGGVQEQGDQTAKQAMAQQMMDQLKQQDDPGKLFMLMQQAEDGEKGAPIAAPKKRKDW